MQGLVELDPCDESIILGTFLERRNWSKQLRREIETTRGWMLRFLASQIYHLAVCSGLNSPSTKGEIVLKDLMVLPL